MIITIDKEIASYLFCELVIKNVGKNKKKIGLVVNTEETKYLKVRKNIIEYLNVVGIINKGTWIF